jgi:hypothetical protein
MKIINISNSLHHIIVDDEDYEILSQMSWSSCGDGSRYAHAFVPGRMKPILAQKYGWKPNPTSKKQKVIMHRLIMLPYLEAGSSHDAIYVDHIDHNTFDNRKSNLRIATISQSSANRRMYSNNSNNLKGITQISKNCFRAAVEHNKIIYKAYFSDKIKAAKFYDFLACRYHGQFCHTNFEQGLVDGLSIKELIEFANTPIKSYVRKEAA